MTSSSSAPTPTPRYQAIVAEASRRAVELGHEYVGTEHLLLALLGDRDAIATQVIEQFAPAPEVMGVLHRVMASEGYHKR